MSLKDFELIGRNIWANKLLIALLNWFQFEKITTSFKWFMFLFRWKRTGPFVQVDSKDVFKYSRKNIRLFKF